MEKNMQIISIVGILVIIALSLLYFNSNSIEEIKSFEDCVSAGYPVMESYPRQCRTSSGELFVEDISNDLDDHFKTQMFDLGVKNLGAIPIEGFTPDLYIGAFPGLKESDFHNVEAINGKYVFENNGLRFDHVSGQLITSADGTVNNQGMAMLLDNLSNRLNIEINFRSDVDKIIESIS